MTSKPVGDAGQQETNLLVLRNLLDNVDTQGTLQHLTILQGGKAYG